MRMPIVLAALLLWTPAAMLSARESALHATLSAAEDEPGRTAFALLLEAEEAFAAGRFALARDFFIAAHAARPHPGFHARIGAAHYQLRAYAEAVQSFEQYLAAVRRAPDRDEVQQMLTRSYAALEASLIPLASLVPPEEQEADGASDGGAEFALLPLDAPAAALEPRHEWASEHGPAEPAGRHSMAGAPFYGKWWFWAAVGTAAVAAGGAAAYGGMRQEPVPVLPSGTLGAADWR
jgi:tetratricopeptide (TPR) repeat protein